ncbi:MAG TPA: glycoside hydrolase domain-containing protein [Bryobacteraceae bacterium]|nr:glycoside hydrolase domain-containing protein [Bryobacteraceae bacterium]
MRVNSITRGVLVAAALSAAALALADTQEVGHPSVWVAPSLHRVGMTESAGSATQANLWAARGEYESFQIVVSGAAAGLSGVNVRVSDLTGPDGETIPKSAFSLYREKYVQVKGSSPNWKGSNQPLPPGWYPDPLIPFNDPNTGKPLSGAPLTAVPFDLKAGVNQPIWVDLLVPRTAKAGAYAGTYTVASKQGEFTGQIALKVWNFALPAVPAMKSAFLFFRSGDLASQKELLRNRISPLSTNPANQAELMKDFGLGATQAGPFGGADIGHCAMSAAPSVEQFKAIAKAQQPGLALYDYSADEVGHCTNIYPVIQQWGRNMHEAGIKNLVTISPIPALENDGTGRRSAVDIWVLLPVMYDHSKAEVEKVLKKGDEVWSYNTLVQDAYSPKWEIDFPPVDFRIQPGFINQSLGLSGLLYWRVDDWTGDPWNNVYAFSGSYPGEGALVYPGKQVGVPGVVASMRLKWLRDGVDDFDYIQILKNMGNGDLALEISRSIARDWSSWTRDPDTIETARKKLGETIDYLSTHPVAAGGSAAAGSAPATR